MVKGFGGANGHRVPTLGASSLPSLVFALLFFFVVMAAVHRMALGIRFALPRNARLRGLRGGSLIAFVCINRPARRCHTGVNARDHVRLGSDCTRINRMRSFVFRRHTDVDRNSTTGVAISLGMSRGAGVNVIASMGGTLEGSCTLGVGCSTAGHNRGWVIGLVCGGKKLPVLG